MLNRELIGKHIQLPDGQAVITWADDRWARATPLNGDPLKSIELKISQLTFVEDNHGQV